MKIPIYRRREYGFTLVEMLAALIAAVVIIGAATGFMLTAAIRQYKVLNANALESRHESLAEAMSASIKSATAFQIYPTDPGIRFALPSLPPGASTGNLLICKRAGLIEEFALSGNQITYTQLDGGNARVRYFDGASTTGGSPLFDSNLGIVQAHWNLTTSLDLVPFSVYGLPLAMQ
jgi:prepilin-type N-terminal cleavage/methylation domain-containing protein